MWVPNDIQKLYVHTQFIKCWTLGPYIKLQYSEQGEKMPPFNGQR